MLIPKIIKIKYAEVRNRGRTNKEYQIDRREKESWNLKVPERHTLGYAYRGFNNMVEEIHCCIQHGFLPYPRWFPHLKIYWH